MIAGLNGTVKSNLHELHWICHVLTHSLKIFLGRAPSRTTCYLRKKKSESGPFQTDCFLKGIAYALNLEWINLCRCLHESHSFWRRVRTNIDNAYLSKPTDFRHRTATVFHFSWTLLRLLMPVMIENRCPRCHVERMSCSMLPLGGGEFVRNFWFDTNLGGGIKPRKRTNI